MAKTKRAPWGHVSRRCRRCGKVGPRIIDAGGWVHFYCLTPEEKRQRRVPRAAPLLERNP